VLGNQFKRFMNSVHLIVAAVLVAGTLGTSALAADPRHAASVTTGDLAGVDGSAEFVLQAAVTSADMVYLVLDDAMSEVVLRVPRAALRDVSLALGDTVTVAADGFGWLVQSAGRTLAVVAPEAIGALR
jgi:hypothetical protein